MKTINIDVKDETAERYLKMSDAEKKSISRFVTEILEDKRTLKEVMDDMSEYAKQKGLTPEILDSILNEDKEK